MKKQQIIVIHGGDPFDSYEEYFLHLKSSKIDLERMRMVGWKKNLREDLGEAFDVLTPDMPCKQNAKYAEWKIWMDKLAPLLDDDSILIGHSLGGIFLAKYLEENRFPKKIRAVFLVAAPFDAEGKDYSLADFTLPGDLKRFSDQAGTIRLYQSEDDRVVRFDNVTKYKRALSNAEVITFKDRGHFNQEYFPELVSDIQALSSKPVKTMTLCMIVDKHRILLGMKKRGFGAGKWNGFGGKVALGESIEAAAKREMSEECGVDVIDMEKRGRIRFTFDNDDEVKDVHIFAVTAFAGEPVESEEMKPQWFDLMNIPFKDMWRADTYWLPLFLKGSKFCGDVHFNEKHEVTHHDVLEVKSV